MTRRGAFLDNQSGAVAATYAIALTGLIIVGGAAFDYTRIMALDSELQTAADQAALAGVTQLDENDGACARAGNAAIELLRNITLLSNDSLGNSVTVNNGNTIAVTDDACSAFGNFITFYADEAGTIATTDEDAKIITVMVDTRTARYAFTPIGSLISSDARGVATAGMGSAICEVPPIMICSPDPDVDFDADAKRGLGVQATGGSNWAPGDFGFLEVGSGQLNQLASVIAYGASEFDCVALEEADNPEQGNAQVLFEAINTRFDIRPTGGGVLGNCANGLCPAALNTVIDLFKPTAATNGNQCRLGNSGWRLPPVAQRFNPRAFNASDTRTTPVHYDHPATQPYVMGLTRDLCHYTDYNVPCTSVNGGFNERFGNGHWAIGDYFLRYHPGVTLLAPDAHDPITGQVLPTATKPHTHMTRYETYLWEMSAGGPGVPDVSGGDPIQRGLRICQPGTASIDRRVLTVAIVTNCDELRGGSRQADIDEWADVFLVEAVVDENTERTRGRVRDSIYIEIIREATLGSGAAGSGGPQSVRRDKPVLLE